MGLSNFITRESDRIMAEFEAFASQQLPAAAEMDASSLRDHARQVLAAIALDMRQPQTRLEQREKSLGHETHAQGAGAGAGAGAAEVHGSMRAAAGFDVNQTAGEYRALRASVIRLWLESGPHLGRDEVFELVRFNEAMDEALAASLQHFASEAARMRNLFLGVLSHELRTPVATIMTSGHCLELAARQDLSVPAAVDRVLRGSRRIQSVLDDLLDYVRSGLGEGMRVSPSDVDLGQVGARIVAELRANHPERTISLETRGDMRCACDPERIAQALSNLVGNALKYGDADTPVEVTLDGSRPDEMAVNVRNSGPPIARATHESLFEPLARNADAREDGYSLGLGLYIVREIARAHGGTATVTSDARDGTVFSVRMPRDTRAASTAAFPGLRMS